MCVLSNNPSYGLRNRRATIPGRQAFAHRAPFAGRNLSARRNARPQRPRVVVCNLL